MLSGTMYPEVNGHGNYQHILVPVYPDLLPVKVQVDSVFNLKSYHNRLNTRQVLSYGYPFPSLSLSSKQHVEKTEQQNEGRGDRARKSLFESNVNLKMGYANMLFTVFFFLQKNFLIQYFVCKGGRSKIVYPNSTPIYVQKSRKTLP